MKRLLSALIFFAAIAASPAQVAINDDQSDPDASAMLDVKATDKGVLVPRMTAVQRDAIASPATGLLVYVTDAGDFFHFDGSVWRLAGEGALAASGYFDATTLQSINRIESAVPSASSTVSAGANETSTDSTATSGTKWQSFTATRTGTLASVQLQFEGTGSVTVSDFRIFTNTDPDNPYSGTLLHTQADLTGTAPWVELTLSPELSVVAGQRYFLVVTGDGEWRFNNSGSDVFAGGRASTGTGLDDYAFRTLVRTSVQALAVNSTSGDVTMANGAISVVGRGEGQFQLDAVTGSATLNGSLTLTDGSDHITFPNTDGTGGQVLVTDGDGTLFWGDRYSADLYGIAAVFGTRDTAILEDTGNESGLNDIDLSLGEARQTFTAAGSGALQTLGLYLYPTADSVPVTIAIYAGDYVTDTLPDTSLVSQSFTVTDPGWSEFTWESGPSVEAGSTYTIVVTLDDSEEVAFWRQAQTGDPYAGGRASTGAADDFLFRTSVKPSGDVSLLALDQTSGQVSLANGAVAVVGQGEGRVYFDASKGAFYAGATDEPGYEPTAGGLYSTAFGHNALASGGNAFAVGDLVVASGDYSMALGIESVASGRLSMAIGEDAAATAPSSVSIGDQTTASARAAIAIGKLVTASGPGSIGVGEEVASSGDGSLAIGRTVTSTAQGSVAFGSNAHAGDLIFNGITLPGMAVGAVAWGSDVTSNGAGAFAIGQETTAIGTLSYAFGNRALTEGENALAVGNRAEAHGARSVALGDRVKAYGDASVALGLRNNAQSFAEFVVGSYTPDYVPQSTTAWNAADRLFVVGNGPDSSNRSTALIVYKNGDATLNGELTLSNGSNSVTFPNADGTLGQVLATDGNGTLGWVTEGDSDAANELQSLSLSGTNLTLSNGGGTISIIDGDGDATNELQALSLSGDTLALTGGGAVDLSGYRSDGALSEITSITGPLPTDPSAAIVDQSNLDRSNALFFEEPIRQTFTAGVSGLLYSVLISIHDDNDGVVGELTLDIYEGSFLEDTSGANWLGSGTLAHTGETGWLEIILADSTTLVAGDVYTMEISDSVSGLDPGYSLGNRYAGGSLYENPDGDLTFQTKMRYPVPLLNLNDDGSLSLGAPGLPVESLGDFRAGNIRLQDGNQASGRVLVSDANGVMQWTNPTTISTAPDGDSDATNEIQNLSSSVSGTNRTISISGGTGTTISVADNDNSTSNELQTLSLSGTNLTLSNGGGTVSINDADSSATNELQTLSQSGGTVTLSDGGGSVAVPWAVSGTSISSTNTGNVGVGTTSPDTKLSVVGYVRAAYEAAETNYTEIGHGGSNGFIRKWGAGNLDFRTQTGTWMSLTDDGELGIGTDDPTALLDVNGTVRIRSGAPVTGKVLTATDSTGDATWKTPGLNSGSTFNTTGQTVTGSTTGWQNVISNSIALPDLEVGDRIMLMVSCRVKVGGTTGTDDYTFRVGQSGTVTFGSNNDTGLIQHLDQHRNQWQDFSFHRMTTVASVASGTLGIGIFGLQVEMSNADDTIEFDDIEITAFKL